MSAGKGDKVAQGYRTKAWENSAIWAEFERNKTENQRKKELEENGIKILIGGEDG